jgi:L-fuculose-phosphate aldolase
MAKFKKRPVIPIYAIALVWVIFTLVHPLYRVSDYVTVILLSPLRAELRPGLRPPGKGGHMNPPYPSDAQAKAEILDAGRKIYQRGLVAANDGNLSVRVGDNALWVTPTGVSKGAMTEDMLVKLSLDGTVLEGTRKPSSETKMHLRIYQENPAVRAVVHAHPPAATAFAAAGLPLDRPVLQEAVVQLGTVPVAPFALPGSQAVADSVAPYCQAYRALLLEYHGAVTWGTSMEQAHYRLECLEQLATVTLHLRTLGIHRTMPESLVKALEGLRPAWGIQ